MAGSFLVPTANLRCPLPSPATQPLAGTVVGVDLLCRFVRQLVILADVNRFGHQAEVPRVRVFTRRVRPASSHRGDAD